MTPQTPAIPALKSQASRLRIALAETGRQIGHSAALEMIAKQHGFKDWNTASAHSRNILPASPFNPGDSVSGDYLGQEFHGLIHAVELLSHGQLSLRIFLRA